jgi:hypothetical protein
MSEYLFLADNLRKTLLEEYLTVHPDVKAHEIEKKAINYRYINEAITEAFESFSGRVKDAKPLEKRGELALSTEERYKLCRDALRPAKYIVGQLFQHRHENFDLTIKKEFENNLRKLDKKASAATSEIHKIQLNLLTWVESQRPSRVQIREVLENYMKHLFTQFDTLCSIYHLQVDLLAEYRDFIPKLIDGCSTGKNRPSSATIKAIIHLCKLLKDTDDIGHKVTQEGLEATVLACNEHIKELRIHLKDMAAIITYLRPFSNETPEENKTEKQPTNKPEQKDSFFSKLFK